MQTPKHPVYNRTNRANTATDHETKALNGKGDTDLYAQPSAEWTIHHEVCCKLSVTYLTRTLDLNNAPL